jgi:integrase
VAETRWLTPKQAEDYAQCDAATLRRESRIRLAADPYIADFFTAMLETACRPGELRTLQWSEVKQDHFVILPAKAKTRRERRIPILRTLRGILDRRRIGPDGLPLDDKAFVFANETGEEMPRRRLCNLWLATCARAKVVNLHLHDLRGEAASQLSDAGAPDHEVRDALGHSSTLMTNTYLRTRINTLQKTYERRASKTPPDENGPLAHGDQRSADRRSL